MDLYDTGKPIGSGSFGQVYLARHKREDRLYVIKKIKIRDMSQKDRENTENEVRLLQKLRHPNIVAYKDSYLDRELHLNIVMIHCEGGDIYQKIRLKKPFPEHQILDWFAQMSLAIYYLHEQKILHRDLKTQNIFLKNGRVRLGDFGIAKVLDSTRDLANTCIGTPFYMSPELFKNKPYSYKSDIWSMGCCLYEMCNLRHAFDAQSINGLAIKILKGQYPPISQNYSKNLRDLIDKMLSIDPKLRPTIWEIVHKPMIKNRIILFMLEVMQSQATDLDDMYVDTLYEQAEKLQINPIIQHYQKLLQSGVSFQDVQKEIEKGGKGEQKLLLQIQEQELLKKKQLKREQLEKEKIEKEINKLEKKQERQNPKLQPQQQKKQQLVSLEREKKPAANTVKGKDRSFSMEKDTPTQQRKQLRQNANVKVKKREYKGSVEERTEAPLPPQFVNQQTPSVKDKETKTFDQFEQVNAKQKILDQKKKKNEEEQQKYEKEYQQIQQENLENRKKAQELKQAQYRPSSGMNQIFKSDKDIQSITSYNADFNKKKSTIDVTIDTKDESNEEIYIFLDSTTYQEDFISKKSTESKKQTIPSQKLPANSSQIKIQEEQSMFDEQSEEDNQEEEDVDTNAIPEVDNEDDYEEQQETPEIVENKLNMLRTRLIEKTQKINDLQQSLIFSTKQKEQQIKAFQNGQVSSIVVQNPVIEHEIEVDLQEEEDQETEDNMEYEQLQSEQSNNVQLTPIQIRMNDRIKLLKHRCEAGLGHNLFEKGLQLAKKTLDQKSDEVRQQMIDLLGEENVGYWHLLDQLLYVEDLFKQSTSE